MGPALLLLWLMLQQQSQEAEFNQLTQIQERLEIWAVFLLH